VFFSAAFVHYIASFTPYRRYVVNNNHSDFTKREVSHVAIREFFLKTLEEREKTNPFPWKDYNLFWWDYKQVTLNIFQYGLCPGQKLIIIPVYNFRGYQLLLHHDRDYDPFKQSSECLYVSWGGDKTSYFCPIRDSKFMSFLKGGVSKPPRPIQFLIHRLTLLAFSFLIAKKGVSIYANPKSLGKVKIQGGVCEAPLFGKDFNK